MRRLIAILLLCTATLVMLGAVVVSSVTIAQPTAQLWHLHLRWLGVGALCCAGAAALPYGWLRRGHLPWLLLGVAVVLLVAVLVPGLGVMKNGARRWLFFGGQPSEFAKLALVLFLAHYGALHQDRMRERDRGFVWPGLPAALVVALVFFEPDWGTAMLLAVLAALLLFLAGTHGFYLLSAGIISLEVFALLLLHNEMRLARFLSFLDPEKYQYGIGWQAWHALLALGAGGTWGRFFGEGLHKFGHVPECSTDFILAILGEELGLAGMTLVVTLFVTLLGCGARLAWRVTDPFAQLLAAGLTFLIGLQAFLNIGVVTSSLPNKGLPLPFVSYGGSSLVCMLTCVGLLVSVARGAPLTVPGPGWNPSRRGRRVRVGGPVGSLLAGPGDCPPSGLRRRLAEWRGALRKHRFPAFPRHSYQRLPRRMASARPA
jgi:cell division protein FtsW